ncbi:P18 [Plodia interpunctella granulovirus]|uniref:p18 n=1 Tax=Plodia interpunctella granulovirus TaxID=262175 RepID=A0A1L5JGN5_9BBAC|nr:P18 [Plodia interpunctella granulovirus]APO13963.1 P18 [Plodia interpunctella granulovirus]
MSSTLNLYTFRPHNTFCNDDAEDREDYFIQGLVEALHDDRKNKFACFLELKREQLYWLNKLCRGLMECCQGNYYKNHALLDMLNIYKMYQEEFQDDTAAFDLEVKQLMRSMVKSTFLLFSCATQVVVFIQSPIDESDLLTNLLLDLEKEGYITLMKIVRIKTSIE